MFIKKKINLINYFRFLNYINCNNYKQKMYSFNKQIYKKIIHLTIPNFLDIQRLSFKNFLKFGIFHELKVLKKNTNLSKTITILFYIKKYKLLPPRLTAKQALLKRQTYAAQLIIPIKIIDLNKNILFFKWILITHLPLMTKNGHFIFNGSPRVILNQIVRSPGIYFQKKFNQNKIIYSADFIAQRGTWLRLEIDNKKGNIWAKMKRIPKLPLFIFFRCFGLSLPSLIHYINKHNFESYINNFQNYAYLYNELNSKFQENNVEFEKLGKKFLYKKFLNTHTYNLSKIGRFRVNKALGLEVPLDHTILTAKDILFACFYLLECFQGTQQPTDIDALENRKIKSSGELIQTQFMVGLLKFKKLIHEKFLLEEFILFNNNFQLIEKQKFIKQKLIALLRFKTINNTFREFFGTNPLSQLLDQTNPLSEITHKRRLSSLGFGGINRENAGMAIRGIHSTHYGRICPIETPEGQNAGLVNSFTIYAQLNKNGFIETPFYKIYKGLILKNHNFYKFTSNQEQDLNIAPSDIKKTVLNFLPQNFLIPIRKLKQFKYILRNTVNFIAVSPLQMISIATSLIPFIEHNDGNRALMGSNMQRQAIATIKPNLPIVGTGLESKTIADINHNVQAKDSGFISYVDGKKIIIYSLNKLLVTNKKQIFLKQKKLNVKKFSINSNCKIIRTKRKQRKKIQFLNNFQKQLIYFNFQLFHCYSWPKFRPHSFKIFGYLPVFSKFLVLNLQEKKYELFLNFLPILNTNKIFILFDLCFENTFQIFLEILKNYSQTFFYNQTFKNIKSFLTKKSFSVINIFSNKIILINYSQRLLITGSFYILKILKFKNNLNYNFFNSLLKLKNNKIKKNTNFLVKLMSVFIFNKKINKIIIFNKFKINSLNLFTNKSIYYFFFLYLKKKISYLINDKFFLFSNSKYTKKNKYFIFNKINKKNIFSKKNLIMKINIKNNIILYQNIFSIYLKKKIHFTRIKFKQNYFQFNNKIKNNYFKKSLNKSKNIWHFINYELDFFYRSNQDTYLRHRPIVKEGYWVEKGDLLADNSTSFNGQLAIGQNLLIGYTPWEGYNFEDAVLINETIVSKDLFTSLHIERYDIEIRDTSFGLEKIIKLRDFQHLPYLDDNGIVKVGAWVETGDILVSKIAPLKNKTLSAYEKLLYAITDKELPKNQNTSFRVPLGVCGRVIHIEVVYQEKKIKKIKKKIKLNQFLLFLQLNSIIIKKTKPITQFYFYGSKFCFNIFYLLEQKKNFSFYFLTEFEFNYVKLKVNSFFILKNFLFQKINKIFKNKKFLLNKIIIKRKSNSILLSNNIIKILKKFKKSVFKNFDKKKFFSFTPFKFNNKKLSLKSKIYSKDFNNSLTNLQQKILKIHIYIAEKRKIQIGDKIAGRHGNKGIISNILPRQDMPYLADGTCLDLVLNPLGVPSRMNVGQIFECLLGLAGYYLGQNYKIQPFDEQYGYEASRSLTYLKLYEASYKTNQKWLFNPNFPGKTRLFDGRTGQCFEQPVTIGVAYILKLIHLVDEKIHARSSGPYSLVTQQPLRGRSKNGGQRVGEMEVWAFEGFGAAYILQELLTIKSDDLIGRNKVIISILQNKTLEFGTPESFKVLIRELQALCLNIFIYKQKNKHQNVIIDIFNETSNL